MYPREAFVCKPEEQVLVYVATLQRNPISPVSSDMLPWEMEEVTAPYYRLAGSNPMGDCLDQPCQVSDTPTGCSSVRGGRGEEGEQPRAGIFKV